MNVGSAPASPSSPASSAVLSPSTTLAQASPERSGSPRLVERTAGDGRPPRGAEAPAGARPQAPPAPFRLQQALHSRWAGLQGLCVATEVALWRAPTVLLPRLAPYCTTPALRGALVAACGASWLVFVPIVGLVTTLIKARWQKQLFEERSQRFLEVMRSQPHLYTERELPAAIAGELADEGTYLAAQYTQFLTMAMSTASLMTAVALQAATLPFGLPLAGALCGVVGWMYLFGDIGAGSLDGQTKEVREARLSLATTGQQAWDNVVLGNAVNLERWQQDFRRHTNRYYKELGNGLFGGQVQTVLFSLQWMIQSSVSAANTLYSQCFPEQGPLMSVNANAALLNVGSLLSIASEATPLYRQYRDLTEKTERSEAHLRGLFVADELRARMKGERITVWSNGETVNGEQAADTIERFASPGLHTVRGDNGTGKSHLLLLAKQRFGERAMLIPAKHALNFSFKQQASSGEKAMAMFDELKADGMLPPVLLLDEWDQNLDGENRKKLEGVIDGWAKTHSIVQIVHN